MSPRQLVAGATPKGVVRGPGTKHGPSEVCHHCHTDSYCVITGGGVRAAPVVSLSSCIWCYQYQTGTKEGVRVNYSFLIGGACVLGRRWLKAMVC